MISIITGAVLFFGGCGAQKSYRYEDIQRERRPTAHGTAVQDPDMTRGAPAAMDAPITLADAVAIALANNPDNRMAMARIRKAEAMVREADAAFYPVIGFYTEIMAADAPSAYLFKTIDQRKLAPNADFNDPGDLQNFETGVNAQYNLYNSGRDELNRKMAEAGLRISRLDGESVRNTLIASVIQTFCDAVAAREFIQIAEESVSTVEKQVEITRVRLAGGSALKSDLLSLEVRLAESREELVRSESRHQTALAALASLLDAPMDKELELKTTSGSLLDIPPDYAAGVEYAVKNRPEINQTRARVEQSRMAVDAARAGYLPRVDFRGSYYFDDENMSYDLSRQNWTAAVIFNWDIFTGFSTRAAEDKATAMLEESFAADRRTGLWMKMDVKKAYLKLAEADARLEAAQTSVEMAEESLNLVKQQYEGGSSTITRYLEAELDRNRAKIRAAAAFHDQKKALAEIGRAIGYWGKVNRIGGGEG
ncbi:MAG: TolC family protein [Desulfobacterales bacterium]|nr:TolC family protein [Desulfobacterales bacterium]